MAPTKAIGGGDKLLDYVLHVIHLRNMKDHQCNSFLCDGRPHQEFGGMMLCEYETNQKENEQQENKD